MEIKDTKSWHVVVSSDLSLNFAIFTGCLYGLIDDGKVIDNNKLWSPNYYSGKIIEVSMGLLKEQ